MWPLRVYTRKKRAGQRLNLTPTPDPGSAAKAEAPPGLKREGKARGLPRIAEKVERSRRAGGGSGPLSTQLGVTGEKSLEENSSHGETPDEKMAPLGVRLSLQHDISSSLLSYSVTDSFLCHFPSAFSDWECPKLKDHMQWKNSTLLDTSKAVTIEKAAQFSDLSAILSASSEDYQKCHNKIVMTLADQSISPKPKCTSNSESDNAACEVLLAEKTCPSTPAKTKKKASIKSNEIVAVSSLQEHSSNEFPSNASEICCIIRASPGTRLVKSKRVIVKKKKYSPPKDIPQDIIIKMADRNSCG
ncbi:PREDICTED: meiosis-specific kinetochore protein [Propithecus coquereli]|uniref:meiosis-specific kinetochore protein n=1 Tax=Propithecus coquereli TaxID=379532 RepID=UPI00063FCDF4|nr:PREDICTED: meiosis-specific kinetochore protein [Propithecus coquereli]